MLPGFLFSVLGKPVWSSYLSVQALNLNFWLSSATILGFPCGSAGKESACNGADLGSIPGLARSPGEGKGYPLQYYGMENSMDYTVHGVAKSQTWLSYFHFHFTFHLVFNLEQLGISQRFWIQNSLISPIYCIYCHAL